MHKAMRKGFTLVELLIVIVIIGILAAAMMLSGQSGNDAARASNIINNLKNLKTAAFMYYADHMNFDDETAPVFEIKDGYFDISKLAPYIDNLNLPSASNYSIRSNDVLSAAYDLTNEPKGVGAKLEGKKQSIGLWGNDKCTVHFKKDDTVVFMRIM